MGEQCSETVFINKFAGFSLCPQIKQMKTDKSLCQDINMYPFMEK